jgi:CENP-B N-terminal DNA-binding domain
VELVRLYSNLSAETVRLRRVGSTTSSTRPAEGSKRHPRQHQRRLSMTEVAKLIKEYEQQSSVKELAQRFGIHRLTVTALLRRHGVELRRTGLAPAEISAAARLHSQGWSLARLGAKFGVDAATVWRALRAADVPRSPKRLE